MMNWTGEAHPKVLAAGLALLRLVTGIVFVMHGQQKFFELGIGGTGGFFESLGIPLPGLAALVVATVELVGGLALVLGVTTRLAGLLLAVDMIVAFAVVHAANGFFVATNGYELVLMLGGAALTLVLTGAGAYSIDALLRSRRQSPVMRLAPSPAR